ncbi:MAG: cytochrome ubiquinol oxidase subunit I, partial [Comamonadaceae bacterium]
MDLTLLSWTRTQFMGSLGFLVFFMSVSLGLSWMLLLFKWRAGRGGNVAWLAAYRFWVRIFALALVLVLGGGVAVLFQMGALWSGLMERIGNIAGPLLGYAVISVFVFKSCFLGVMLFGQRRVSERMHTFAVAMVAIGQCVALFWLVVLQAWLENPQGARLFEGRFQVYDWAAVILHGSLTWRMGVLACSAALAAAFLILGVTAGQALRRKL